MTPENPAPGGQYTITFDYDLDKAVTSGKAEYQAYVNGMKVCVRVRVCCCWQKAQMVLLSPAAGVRHDEGPVHRAGAGADSLCVLAHAGVLRLNCYPLLWCLLLCV